jgi:hypothetical protein
MITVKTACLINIGKAEFDLTFAEAGERHEALNTWSENPIPRRHPVPTDAALRLFGHSVDPQVSKDTAACLIDTPRPVRFPEFSREEAVSVDM